MFSTSTRSSYDNWQRTNSYLPQGELKIKMALVIFGGNANWHSQGPERPMFERVGGNWLACPATIGGGGNPCPEVVVFQIIPALDSRISPIVITHRCKIHRS